MPGLAAQLGDQSPVVGLSVRFQLSNIRCEAGVEHLRQYGQISVLVKIVETLNCGCQIGLGVMGNDIEGDGCYFQILRRHGEGVILL